MELVVAVVVTVALLLGILAVLNVRGGREDRPSMSDIRFLAGDRPPPEVERDMIAMLEIMRQTMAEDMFAVRYGEHLVMFVNDNAARCSCGWRTIALVEDLDAAVREHVEAGS